MRAHAHVIAPLCRTLLLNELSSRLQGVNPATKRLEIATTANQDPLLSLVPIIGVDVWEHAFYLQYLNVKADVSTTNTNVS